MSSSSILEERKDLLIVLLDGKVETLSKTPYTVLKHKYFQGRRIIYAFNNSDEMELVDSEAIMTKADRLAEKLDKAVNGKKTYFFQGMLRRFTLDPALKKMIQKFHGRYEFLSEAYANK